MVRSRHSVVERTEQGGNEADVREKPSVVDAFQFLERMLANAKDKVLVAGGGVLEDVHLIDAAVEIQTIAEHLVGSLEAVEIELEMHSVGFSPENFDPKKLLIRLSSLEFSHDKKANQKILNNFDKIGLIVLWDVLTVSPSGVLMIHEAKLEKLAGHNPRSRTMRLLEFNLRKNFPIGKPLTEDERAAFWRVQK